MKNHIKLFENFGTTLYHFYEHPCSTHGLFYAIPNEWNDILEHDEDFKIGMYGTPFKEYLEEIYDQPRHGKLQGRHFIEHVGTKEMEMPKWAEKLRYEDEETGAYYYEFVDEYNPKCEWSKLGVKFD
jgi:hypothetical protein